MQVQPQRWTSSWEFTFEGDDPEALGARSPSRLGSGQRLRSLLEHLARALGTCFLFFAFGIGAVVLASVVIPLAVRLYGKRTERELLAQRLIHRSFAGFVRMGEILRLFELSNAGIEGLRAPTLVVANHPTLLDVVMLISRIPQADCVVKQAAWRNPFLRGIVRAAGYIRNDGDGLVEACAERLQAGRTVILFPEGSRSPHQGLRPFKRGAAHIALRSGCSVTPVFIACDPPALNKRARAYIPKHKLRFHIDAGASFFARQVVPEDARPAVAARQLTEWMRCHFQARLDHGTQ